jgi:hypothetical protein
MSLKIIQKNIKTIVTNANKLNVLIHTTAVLVLEHANEHGDCTTALDLVNAMPASMRRTMLVQWFETYSPIRFNMKDGLAVKVGLLKAAAKNFTPFDIDAGREMPFYTLAEQNPEGKVLDFDAILKLVQGMAKRIDKQVEDGKVKPEDIESAKAASIAIQGLRLVRVNGAPVEADLPVQEAPKDEAVDEPNLGLRAVA